MSELDIKKTIEDLIDTFIYAGRVALDLRNKGLIKNIKSDITRRWLYPDLSIIIRWFNKYFY